MEEPIMIKDSDIFHHYAVQDLPISDELKSALNSWDEEYQSTFDSAYPPDSGFASIDLERAHVERGRELAERLQAELGDGYLVEYKP
jgi:hypothetical protein